MINNKNHEFVKNITQSYQNKYLSLIKIFIDKNSIISINNQDHKIFQSYAVKISVLLFQTQKFELKYKNYPVWNE